MIIIFICCRLNMDMMGSKLIQIDKVDENGIKTLNMGKCLKRERRSW